MSVDRDRIRDLYPWESHWLERGPLKMHYLDEGEGETLVLLHGNPTWSFFWRHLVEGLSGSYRTIVPDHIGMGLSDKPGDDQYNYTLESRVDDVEALLDHLDVRKDLTLVLHDWGGMIGLAFAMRHRARIKRLILLNTAGFRLPQGRSLPWQLKLIKRLPFAVPVRGFNAFCRGAARGCSTRKGRMTPAIRDAYLAPYDSWANRIAIHRFVQDIPLAEGDPAWDIVRGVEEDLSFFDSLPVQIHWGCKDFVFDMHFLQEWRRRLPRAEVHTFDDCGHYVLEDAHEEITPLVRDFLARHPLEASP